MAKKVTSPSLTWVDTPVRASVRAAGTSWGKSQITSEAALEVLGSALETALKSPDAYNEWRMVRGAFLEGYMEVAAPADGGRTAWSEALGKIDRIRTETGRPSLVKPASPNADAQRKGKGKTKTAKPAGKTAKTKTAKPTAPEAVKAGAGDAAGAGAVQMTLTAIEAHVIQFLRAGKFSQAAQCIADLATAAAAK